MNLKSRKEASRPVVKKILIVCEGLQTEPNYFRAFRVASRVCDVRGTGRNTESLVKEAVKLSRLADYREVWCVFDRDSFDPGAVRRALRAAQRHGFQVAFSNECFELWYLLHFQYLDTAVNRQGYASMLRKLLGRYEKNTTVMYDLLEDRQGAAIQHAQRLLASHGSQAEPEHCTPYTTVHDLVKRLNKLAETAA